MSNSRIEAREVKIKEISKIYDLSDFDCEDADLNEFLKEDCFRYKEQLTAKTFIVIHEEQVVAFLSVMNDAIKLKLEETEDTDNLKRLHEYPALKIGRLGVDKRFKRRGLGTIMLNFAVGLAITVNYVSACRFITVDSYPDSIVFYEKYGFIKNLMYEKKKDFISMRLDLLERNMPQESSGNG